jgi:thymidylate kinase
VIVFEGPDGCGKTNISKALSADLQVPYFKNTDEWRFFVDDPAYFVNALTYGDPYFLSYLEQTGASVIVDRWYPSEWVYSQVFNRPTNMDALELIDKRASALGTKIVIPYRKDYCGVTDQFKDIITSDVLDKVHTAYLRFVEWTECDTFLLNVDDENLARELIEVHNFLRE